MQEANIATTATNGFMVAKETDFSGEGVSPRFRAYIIKENKYWYAGLWTFSDFFTWLVPEGNSVPNAGSIPSPYFQKLD